MTERTERLLDQARADAMRDILPPGADRVRRTVRRRRAAMTGAAVAVVAALTVGSALAGPGPAGDGAAGGRPDPSATPELPPGPDPRLAAVTEALGDPNTTPWVMATAGIVSPDYEDDVNDIPAGDYRLFVYCLGEGSVDVLVKAGQRGDQQLVAGTVSCSANPAPSPLSLRQPVSGYLRVFLTGDARASAGAAFAFKFVGDRTTPSSLGPS